MEKVPISELVIKSPASNDKNDKNKNKKENSSGTKGIVSTLFEARVDGYSRNLLEHLKRAGNHGVDVLNENPSKIWNSTCRIINAL